MGGVQNSNGNSEGVGGYFSGQNMKIPRRRRGLRKIPSMVGVWIFSGTTQCHADQKIKFMAVLSL